MTSASRRSDGSSGGFADDLLEQRLVDGAGDDLGRSVRRDDDDRRLVGNAEAGVDVAAVVADLWERQTVTIDEVLEVSFATGPCDTDEVDLISELLGCLLDRGASRLQVLQNGAQNHISVGLPVNSAAGSIVPPPTSGAENCNA